MGLGTCQSVAREELFEVSIRNCDTIAADRARDAVRSAKDGVSLELTPKRPQEHRHP
jgi:hypothetical protein